MAFKIYTKTGDQGETSLFGGQRLFKNHTRIESYGTVDELNAFLGLLRDHLTTKVDLDLLMEIQNRLFTVGANLASDPNKKMPAPDLRPSDIKLLEEAIDHMEKDLPVLKHFILPGGHPAVSFCHVARTICRRAERAVVALSKEERVEGIIIQYLNRLSDFLFVLARKIGKDLGVEEIKWEKRS